MKRKEDYSTTPPQMRDALATKERGTTMIHCKESLRDRVSGHKLHPLGDHHCDAGPSGVLTDPRWKTGRAGRLVDFSDPWTIPSLLISLLKLFHRIHTQWLNSSRLKNQPSKRSVIV